MQLWYKNYLHLTPYKKDIIFVMQQELVHGYYVAKIFILFSWTYYMKNSKLESCKSRYLIEIYNLHIKIILSNSYRRVMIFIRLSLVKPLPVEWHDNNTITPMEVGDERS
jgi:hypothetical protein